MQSLINQLENLPITGMITHAGEQTSVVELIIKAQGIRRLYPHLHQQKIALHYVTLIDFVTALIAFDGWCTAIYLCPSKVSPPQKELIKWPVECELAVINVFEKPADPANLDFVLTTWYLATSGTTGEPKWFAHSFLSLTASIRHSDKLQTLCWGLLYQPFRFAGLQVVLQALLSGADVVDVVDHEPMAQTKLLTLGEVTAISATPSLWRQLIMTGQLSQLKLSHITLGGEIADQSVLHKLKCLFPKAKLRHIYASTEAGVGFVVSDGLAGFPANWLEDLSLSVALKVSDTQHLLVKPSYQLCQTLIEQTDTQGYLDSLDKVQITDDRVLFIGRATGTINVGGNKVHPEKVEQVLLQCADICQAKVYAKKSAIMGELVVADVTITEGVDHSDIKQRVLKTCKNQLQRFEIPTKISIVNNIVHDLSGKLNRKQQHD
jgi:acyl-coenzyme A synthetase/AMP-(fatty) acid ligase